MIDFVCEFTNDMFVCCSLEAVKISIKNPFHANFEETAKILNALGQEFDYFNIYLSKNKELIIDGIALDAPVSDSIREMVKEAAEMSKYVLELLNDAGCAPCKVTPVVRGLYE